MYSKIAVGNVKRSFKDYSIYFLTLTLAVCIFYSFNSMESQKALSQMRGSGIQYIQALNKAMAGMSVFVSVILGSLILYANNFLIKKRKKELGIYMTLGMGKEKISRILVIETLIVGAISLISGIILGIGASQGLSTFTLKLFELPINEYKFSVSTGAIGKTILYFGIMFLLVMIFNVFIISKYKIIDLLTSGRKNEDVKFKNPSIYLITFILCVISLGYAYKTIIATEGVLNKSTLILSISLGIVGTVLFFFSLSGFILYVVKKNKKVYFKGLNIFVVKQINSKVNTNFISMSLICLMLFITTVVLSTGIGFKRAVEAGLKQATPFDASVMLDNSDENYNIEDVLKKLNFKISNNEKYAVYNEYSSQIKAGDLLINKSKGIENINTVFVKISDYNKIRKLKGENEASLNKDEVLLLSNKSKVVNIINKKLKNDNKVKIIGKKYRVKNTKAIEENLQTYMFTNNLFTIVINDEFLANYKIKSSILNVNYLDNNRTKYNEKYKNIREMVLKENNTKFNIQYMDGITKDSVYSGSKGITIIILFVGMYLGIVFLITSMAVLALQQLSEASDSIERYKALKKIGANEKMINKTIFAQTLIYFSLPVILAVIHSVVGIKVASDFISLVNRLDIGPSALITVLIFIGVYAGYFYTTYIGYKNIVKSNL
ncbi:ABC transporter permease [Clostridium botulinum]|nr:ABC transporter permease [Clostridium botulinum]